MTRRRDLIGVRTRVWLVRRVVTQACLILTMIGCGVEPCSEERSEGSDAPELSVFALDSQMETDPWTLIFSATFADPDGDLGTGRVEFFLNGQASDTSVELRELFRQSGLPLNATGGRFAIPLRFSDTVTDGAKVKLGVQLVDAADLRSNCYSLELNFAVQPVAARRIDCSATIISLALLRRISPTGPISG